MYQWSRLPFGQVPAPTPTTSTAAPASRAARIYIRTREGLGQIAIPYGSFAGTLGASASLGQGVVSTQGVLKRRIDDKEVRRQQNSLVDSVRPGTKPRSESFHRS